MAEQDKQTGQTGQTGQPGPTEPTEQERKQREQLNRKINYFIMRRMWQVIRGRSSTDTIYAAFATSRERFTRVINTGIIRYGKGELEYLVRITGVRREIFTGKARFKCPYKNAENTLVKDITEAEWAGLFSGDDGKLNALSPAKKEIYEHLDMAKIFDTNNRDFYRLCYFLRKGKPVPDKGSTEYLKEIENAIQGLSFSVLDNYEPAKLEDLHQLLKEKYKLVDGILFYKKQTKK